MNRKKLGSIIFGVVALVLISYTSIKISLGKNVGFNEIIPIAIIIMASLSALTWGNKEDSDGISEEELRKKITKESSKISYFILIVIILVAVGADQYVQGVVNIFLLGVLAIAMVLLPLVECLVARKYQ